MTLRVFVLWAACCTASCSTSAVRKGDRVVVLYGGDACMSPAPLPPNPSDAVVDTHTRDMWLYRACEARMNEIGDVAKRYELQALAVRSRSPSNSHQTPTQTNPAPPPSGAGAGADEWDRKTAKVRLLADYYQRLCKPPLREDATKTFGQSVLGKKECEALATELQCAFKALDATPAQQVTCP